MVATRDVGNLGLCRDEKEENGAQGGSPHWFRSTREMWERYVVCFMYEGKTLFIFSGVFVTVSFSVGGSGETIVWGISGSIMFCSSGCRVDVFGIRR